MKPRSARQLFEALFGLAQRLYVVAVEIVAGITVTVHDYLRRHEQDSIKALVLIAANIN